MERPHAPVNLPWRLPAIITHGGAPRYAERTIMQTHRTWTDDEKFATVRAKLFPAVIGDVMDEMGFLNQFLPPSIQPLRDDMVVLGRAMPVLEEDLPGDSSSVPSAEAANPHKPFGLMLEALDDLRPNEVYLCSGSSGAFATWGELMSTRARQLGSAGAVLHGYSRDTPGILKLNFPTFSTGRYAQDQRSRGQVVGFRTTIQIGRTKVQPGDIVFGDLDGVLVIPQAIEDDVLRLSLERIEREELVRAAFEKDNMSALEASARFGVM